MVSAERQEIMETNRSLRSIKNELESLLEKGVITEDAFDGIHALLPAEAPLSSVGTARHTPSLTTRNGIPAPTAPPPTNAMAALALNATPSADPAPPSYHQTGPPSLPSRTPGPPTGPPAKPVLAHARALYKYGAADARDVSFEKDDRHAVPEYKNDDWWMGRNLRTGQEGIFPKSYVLVEPAHEKAAPAMPGLDARGYPGAVGYQHGPPGPPPQQNPYDANVPPMAVAEGSHGGGGDKVQNAGKKFGKKLGNAAIFGAGATIGSNIVNSIF